MTSGLGVPFKQTPNVFNYMYSTNPLLYSGIAAIVLAWIVILISMSLNPWFSVFRGALSDLGGPRASYAWVYNYGLVAAAVLAFIFATYSLMVSYNKIEALASSFVAVAAIFLALIGIFHEGTYPHAFVSLWFFVQMDIAAVVWGIGLIISGNLNYGLAALLMGALAPIPAAVVKWPSTAMLEIYGILIIDALTIMLTMALSGRTPVLRFNA